MHIKRRYLFTFVLFVLMFHTSAIANVNSAYPNTNEKNPDSTQFSLSRLSNKQQFISVKGNKLVNELGQNIIFKGLNIADPGKLLEQNKWSKALFAELNAWGANIIRLPIHPMYWRKLGRQKYIQHLDDAVTWANQYNMYLIIDWHSIGYLPKEIYQHKMYDTTIHETKAFWQDISYRYQNVPTIAVYELFNEPTDLAGKVGKANWAEWKKLNEELIDIIYRHDPNVIPLVAGFNWAYDLRPIADNPIDRPGIAYTSHPYPQKAKPTINSKQNYFDLWDEVWGFAAKKYPIIATEIGWVKADGKGAHIPVINDGSYGPQIIEFMQQRGISWVAWVFDPDWSPTMISDWQFTPTQQGVFFKQELLKK
ncbi:cellulase family glycosylhydrolase [Paraglaciecola aquimarina]|uniref:Cellulase family glycosylhydrolase n=1 Tax=Paraglaciecola aquimarina TaxID=1235557 RepID=A0ABU3SZR2_9ALTE|nr:cellulase family glycosylhydrolase [Paraglaciecola aquimarina]MDU0355500.1 cellulase family glycosylhydrolase [Paraglaciecola aquimarina]